MSYALQKLAEKTVKGHKGTLKTAHCYECECGWRGHWYGGEDSMQGAAAEFQYHKLQCLKANAE